MGRKRRKKTEEDERMDRILAMDVDEQVSASYKEKMGDEITPELLKTDPGKQIVWQVLEWLFQQSGTGDMDAKLAAVFDKMLKDYKIKNRIMAYAVTRERIQRLVELVELEGELSADIRDRIPYMSNENKVKALAAISTTIVSSLENLDKMAGITDVSEEVLSALQGHLKTEASKPFQEATVDERENIRKFMEMLRHVTNPDTSIPTTQAPEEEADGTKAT